MKVKITIDGMREVLDEIKYQSIRSDEAAKETIKDYALLIERRAKENLHDLKAVDTGNLSRSITTDLVDAGYAAEVGSDLLYAIFVEFGTRPHFPPMKELESWARRHGFESAWPVCKAIAERGLKARPYLFPAYEASMSEFLKELGRRFEKGGRK